MTPDQFERRHGIPARRLRSYLRKRWPHRKNDPWHLTDEMMQDALEYFGLHRRGANVDTLPPRAVSPPSDGPRDAPEAKPNEIDEANDAVVALEGTRMTPERLDNQGFDKPGLYAIWGTESVWNELSLLTPESHRPLYVGKSEDSLRGRDFRTHFSDGRTGTSTVRRSFASLLVDVVDLTAIPRSASAKQSQFKLDLASESKLTSWMRQNLQVSVWVRAPQPGLGAIETHVIHKLGPALNLDKSTTRWKPQVSAARAEMARRSQSG